MLGLYGPHTVGFLPCTDLCGVSFHPELWPFLEGLMPMVKDVWITGSNQNSEEATGRVTVDLILGSFATKVTFYIIDADTTYRILLGRPWLHENWVIPSTLHQCIKYAREGKQHTVFADQAPFREDECNLTDALLYLGGPALQLPPRSKGKGKQIKCSDEDSETGELFVINKNLVELHAKNFRSKAICLEKQNIKHVADYVSQGINGSIPLPPNCLQISFPKQHQSVQRLKTFVVTYQRKEEKEKARKASKPIHFYKGEPIAQTSLDDDFDWENQTQNHLEPIEEMADMPESIKEMCKKQNIPQVQNTSRRNFFKQLWEPSQVRGQPPFPRKDIRGLGYEAKVFFSANVVGLLLDTGSAKSSQASSNSNPQEDIFCPTKGSLDEESSEESDEQSSPINSEDTNFYEVLVAYPDDEEDFVDLQLAPQEIEDGGQATVDELIELNLGDQENPRPVFISTLLDEQERELWTRDFFSPHSSMEFREVYAYKHEVMNIRVNPQAESPFRRRIF
ncbi:hypothetical protein Taro_004107 [Colocasia esculenta]|uniref:Uncharacterized protein n=1 Tax=Colocasia esculenta TaxID=4460 RepID=A0A843TQS8_COLES|nr:hypothetical protein [Colocasia esculenta]